MVTITNTFYTRSLLTPLVHSASKALSELQQERRKGDISDMALDYHLTDEEMEIDGLFYSLRSPRHAYSPYITENEMFDILDKLQEIEKVAPNFVYDHDAVQKLKDSAVTVTTDVQEATEQHHELMKLLSRYHNLVGASNTVSGHGKSWEPLVSVTRTVDNTYEVDFSSYQAGDRQEDTITGELKDIITAVQKRVDDVEPALLTGQTNSNPLVMMMTDENTDDTVQVFNQLEEDNPYVYQNVFFVDGVFLPDTTMKSVEFSGYVYDDSQKAILDYGYDYFPSAADVIGMDQLDGDQDDNQDEDDDEY